MQRRPERLASQEDRVTARHLTVEPSSGSGNFRAPRGPMVNAKWILKHFFTDEETGESVVKEPWIRANVPGKVRLSYNEVAWFRDDVVAYFEKLRTNALNGIVSQPAKPPRAKR